MRLRAGGLIAFRARALAFAAGPGIALAASACDQAWDFECKATWSHGPKLMTEKVYTYYQLPSEQDATAQCKKDMMSEKPKRANSARCKCVGK